MGRATRQHSHSSNPAVTAPGAPAKQGFSALRDPWLQGSSPWVDEIEKDDPSTSAGCKLSDPHICCYGMSPFSKVTIIRPITRVFM